MFSYDDDVRPEIAEAHNSYWQKLAKPGHWWTGAERVAIARASREAWHCSLCVERRQALSPNQVKGTHDSSVELPAVAVDAVHRIVTDQSRISQSYIESNEAEGLPRPAYVELVGIVVAVLSIDEFHRGLSLPLMPLPTPEAGEPDHYLPPHLESETGFVPMIPVESATGNEADLWSRDRTANVVRALSLVPDAVRDWRALGDAQYLSFEGMGNFGQPEGRSLDRMQIELVAGRVSAMNECFY